MHMYRFIDITDVLQFSVTVLYQSTVLLELLFFPLQCNSWSSSHPPSWWHPLEHFLGPSTIYYSLDVSNTKLILCFISCKTEYCNPNVFLITWFCILFFFDIITNYLQKSILTITNFFFLKCHTSKTHNAVFFITVL